MKFQELAAPPVELTADTHTTHTHTLTNTHTHTHTHTYTRACAGPHSCTHKRTTFISN